eukprot:TRINITY_DN5720_c0_g1_i2.p2 TRINITY_DN5720_c0_g1~~TRINITY_DN5720_c0_g1_i2.p2  ORF type:complete len:114 (-),score=26.17 TRINITY_DN5720_c0_g1_i2:47-388(-)
MLVGYDALRMQLKGDGRTYMVTLRTDPDSTEPLFQLPLHTKKGEWQDFVIPFSSFVHTWKGLVSTQQVPVDTDNIESLGLTLMDDQEGEYSVVIKQITAIRRAAFPNPESVPS